MAKKKASSKKIQANSLVAQIQKLHACIAKDESELAKLYKKAVSEADKKLASIHKLLVKAKKSVIQATKDKKKSPKNYQEMTSLLLLLKNDMALVKAEQTNLKTKYKHFLAQEKARQQVDKISVRTAKPLAKLKSKILKNKKPKKLKSSGSKIAVSPEVNFVDTSSIAN
jgi:hypothetical protein